MSAAVVSDQPNEVPDASPPARLRLVPTVAPSVSTLGFVGIVACIVAAGIGLVMVVTTSVTAQSREASALRKEATELGYQAAALTHELQQKSSSGSLALRAADLGMVPNPFPAFLKLADGTILGEPRPVKGDESPYLRGIPQTTPVVATPQIVAGQPVSPAATVAPTAAATPAGQDAAVPGVGQTTQAAPKPSPTGGTP